MQERTRGPGPIDLDFIREEAKSIVDQSPHILTIDYNSIERVLIPKLRMFQEEMGLATKEAVGLPPLEKELGLVLFFNVVNFCYKDPVSMHEYVYESGGKKYTRSTGLFTAMKESEVDWNHLRLISVMASDAWERIIQLGVANPLYLGDERNQRIRGFAKHLLGLGHDTVSHFIKSTNLDAISMVTQLSESGYFTDEFLKRAQLTVRMLNDVFEKRELAGFKNTEVLTAMADYRIPQVFYNEGVVRLNPNLHQKLLREEPIKSDSREERVLRSTVVVISEYLSKKMGVTEGGVDRLLWFLSQKMAKEGSLPIPHMLVATDKY